MSPPRRARTRAARARRRAACPHPPQAFSVRMTLGYQHGLCAQRDSHSVDHHNARETRAHAPTPRPHRQRARACYSVLLSFEFGAATRPLGRTVGRSMSSPQHARGECRRACMAGVEPAPGAHARPSRPSRTRPVARVAPARAPSPMSHEVPPSRGEDRKSRPDALRASALARLFSFFWQHQSALPSADIPPAGAAIIIEATT